METIHMDKRKHQLIKLRSRLESSMTYLTLLSAQSGSSNGIIVKTSNQSCPCTLHPLLNTKRECRHLCIPIPCEERKKTPLLFFPSWFLAMQYPKEREFKSPYRLHIRVLWGFNQSSLSPPLLLHILNLLCRTDFICEGLLCANVWNDCCTGLCATHTWASWELYFFSKIVVHLLK